MTSRRDLLKTAAVSTGLLALGSAGSALAAPQESLKAASSLLAAAPPAAGEHTLPALPYAYDALEPFIDAATLKIHHTKHHQGYVTGLNATEKALIEARKSGDMNAVPSLEQALAFHGSGHVNHSLYWQNMKPKGQAKALPGGKLLNQINKDFGTYEAFKKQFDTAALKAEGNGWAALLYHPMFKRLYIATLLNHQNSMLVGGLPLLLCDVWEHAYYVKYQNMRLDYIAAWWNVVDWADVESRFDAANALG